MNMRGAQKMLNSNIIDLIDVYTKIHPIINKDDKELETYVYIQKLLASSILNSLILSKAIFKKNVYIEKFLKENFDIEMGKSAFKSRTLICGKITRYIYSIDNSNQLIDILNTLFSMLLKIQNDEDLFSKDIYDVIRGIDL